MEVGAASATGAEAPGLVQPASHNAMLVSAMGLLVIVYARYYLSPDDPAARFYSLLLGFMGAMLGVVLSV